eukprot:656005-Alexandrium_andersonii.AAC.1
MVDLRNQRAARTHPHSHMSPPPAVAPHLRNWHAGLPKGSEQKKNDGLNTISYASQGEGTRGTKPVEGPVGGCMRGRGHG